MFLHRAGSKVLGINRYSAEEISHVVDKVAWAAQFVYYFVAKEKLRQTRAIHFYMDGSSVGGSPCELVFVWSPELRKGAYAPVYATRADFGSEQCSTNDLTNITVITVLD